MDNLLGYLFAAYSVIFVLIALYVIFIGRREAQLEREVGRLEEALRDLQQAAPTEQRSNQL